MPSEKLISPKDTTAVDKPEGTFQGIVSTLNLSLHRVRLFADANIFNSSDQECGYGEHNFLTPRVRGHTRGGRNRGREYDRIKG